MGAQYWLYPPEGSTAHGATVPIVSTWGQQCLWGHGIHQEAALLGLGGAAVSVFSTGGRTSHRGPVLVVSTRGQHSPGMRAVAVPGCVQQGAALPDVGAAILVVSTRGQLFLWRCSTGLVHGGETLPMKMQYQFCPPGGSTAHMGRVLVVLTRGKHWSYSHCNSCFHQGQHCQWEHSTVSVHEEEA